MLPGFVLAVAALALRGGSTNRHVRGRLLASAALFALNVAAIAVARSGYLNADLQSRIALAAPLLLALGVINALVALAVNPWRDDRVPERFPRIVQDSIVIAAFALAAFAGRRPGGADAGYPAVSSSFFQASSSNPDSVLRPTAKAGTRALPVSRESACRPFSSPILLSLKGTPRCSR